MSVQSLLEINVNDLTSKKGNLTYLPWAMAWGQALKADPAATFEVQHFNGSPCCYIGKTALVYVTVTMFGKPATCQLPVMDNRNKAIEEPNAFDVNRAIMRCMTKALALHGLGLYIYAGEDLPSEGEAEAERTQELEALALDLVELHHAGKDMEAIKIWNDPATFREDRFGTNQEDRLFVWGLLKTESKLRSTIRANKPDEQPPDTQ